MPITSGEAGSGSGQSGDKEVVFVPDILQILVKLCINGGLEIEPGGQASVALLKDTDSIGHDPDGLVGLGQLGRDGWGLAEGTGGIEQMYDEPGSG